MLEPCAVKVACTVLRGLGAGNSPRLPDSSILPEIDQPQDIGIIFSYRRFGRICDLQDIFEPTQTFFAELVSNQVKIRNLSKSFPLPLYPD